MFLHGVLFLWPLNKLQIGVLLNNGTISEQDNMTYQKMQICAPICKHSPAFHAVIIHFLRQHISLSDYL